jgi:hypothetical protein
VNDSDFITVFDVANTGYRDWWFPAFGLIFIVIGAILPRLFEAGLFPEYQKKMFGGWFPKLWLGFAIFWTAIAFITTFGAYVKDRESLMSGKAGYVEGIVTNFIPMPYQGHAQESFNVDGVSFNYSDYGVTAGFNNSASHGGPIREGIHVRIWYSGNDILKLQIPKSESPQTVNSLPASARPPLVPFPMFMVFWIGLGVGSWILIARLPTPKAKKRWSDRLSIIAGIIFFAFLFTQFSPTKGSFGLFIMGPAIALITWLNVRNTYFCDKCGKRSLDRNWFGDTYSCPHCGNKIK